MDWKCSYPMQWNNILFVTNAMLTRFQDAEVLIGDKGAGCQRANPANQPEEKSMLNLRGYSTLFGGNISIVFNTKTDNVKITIAKSIGFPSDYESLAKAVGPFMDNIELRMYVGR